MFVRGGVLHGQIIGYKKGREKETAKDGQRKETGQAGKEEEQVAS